MPLAEQQWCPTSVQVTVLQARGLRIKGKGGTNDAYAVMQVGKEKFQTSVVEKSVAPAWREEAAFDLPPLLHQDGGGGGGKERGTLHVHVLHRALVGPDKLLGQAVVNLLQLGEDKTREKTEWFKLLDKTGKADKDRGEVLLDIQFMRHNMTASMFDLSATGKSRSRLGKFKDKVRGKKKESDTASDLVPSFTQVLTDSDEEGPGDGEASAAKGDKKKKHKMKSLFSHKSNLQKNMSQSMTVLTAKNLSLSGSQSSGLNVDSSEGKKKFKFLIHKRSNSSDSKDASSGHQKHGAAEPSNVCINGSHVYCEEPPPRASRVGSSFSLASSGHGSMEDVPESSPPSVDSLKGVRQYSPWTEEEEEQELENTNEDAGQLRRDEEEKLRMEEEMRRNEELERLADEKRRQEDKRTEEDNVKRVEEERIRREEEERRQQQQEEEEERVKREQEECDRLAEQKLRLQEQERLIEEERVRKEEEERIHKEKRQKEDEMVRRQEVEREEKRRFEEQERSLKEEEERTRMEEESAKKERRQEEEERVRRQEEECKLAEEKRLEEEERIEEDKLRKEEEERIRREEEMAEEERKRVEEIMRRQEEKHKEKTRLEELERRRREHEERIKKEEEQKARREKEEHERLVEEKRELEEEERIKVEEEQKARREKEEHARLVEEKRKLEEEERIKVEEEQKARREKEEHARLIEEKRKLEEEERIKAEEKIRREEEERIRVEEERRNEEERVRRQEEEQEQLAEEKRILEDQERRREKERKQREEEEMRIREEENSRKEKEENERLVVEKMRQQEQERRMIEEEKIKREEEERVRRKEKAERERKEEEARKKETLTREAEEQNKDNKTKHKAAGKRSGQKVAVESRAEVTSTNPFDENVSSNPFEEIPDSPAGPGSSSAKVPTDQQRVQSAASSVGSKPVSSDEKDPINTQRERRPAPQPPGRNPAERPSQREQDGATQQLAQINKRSKDKDIKTVSVLPQRSVQTIAPMSRASTEKKNTQSLTQSCATKETSNIVKHSKRTAPPTPRYAEEEPSSEHKTALSSDDNISHECGSEAKPVSIVYGLNPFEDDEVENAAEDDATTSGNTRSVKCPQVLSQAASKDAASQAKTKSSKAHAPPLPTKIAATSSASILQNTERGHVAAGAGVTVNSVLHLTRDPASEAVKPVRVQEAPLQDAEPAPMQSAGGDSGGMKVGAPKASRRLQPVKPLNSLEQQSVSVFQGVKENNSTCDVQVKTKVNDTGLKGPYSQLTQGELISLVLKQEKQLSERDKKISELEKYIDDLLVRVMEEKPSILMSMNSLKKST